jgi:taurine dioxygenase
MVAMAVEVLSDELPFGARISGLEHASLRDAEVRRRLLEVFEDRGVILFRGVESTREMHTALSEVFGSLQQHPLRKGQPNVGVVEIDYKGTFSEVGGQRLAGWLPWHFDACYTDKLNRAAVLRAVAVPPDGGMTGFVDGVQLYGAISPELREAFEQLEVLYHPTLMYMNQRFGVPRDSRWLSVSPRITEILEVFEAAPRSAHPAVWTRRSGERVLHVSPWQAAGIAGHETQEGDRLLERLCQEIYRVMRPYWHRWSTTDMVIWDNWRFLHAASGNDPQFDRRLERTTIKGDYGLGRFDPRGEGLTVQG